MPSSPSNQIPQDALAGGDLEPGSVSGPTIPLPNTALAWSERLSNRHKLYQDLHCRFYLQIRFGCKNPDCATPTCLTAQKRASNGLHRNLRNLNAWTLARVLASQDHPHKSLCQNEARVSLAAFKAGQLSGVSDNWEEKHDHKSLTQKLSAYLALRKLQSDSVLEEPRPERSDALDRAELNVHGLPSRTRAEDQGNPGTVFTGQYLPVAYRAKDENSA